MRRSLVVGLALLLSGGANYPWPSIATELPQPKAARSEGPNIDLNSDRVRNVVERADKILSKVQQTCAAEHLRFIGSTHFVPTWAQFGPDFVSHIGQTLTSVIVGSDEQEFTLSYDNGHLKHYANRALEDLPEANLLFDPPDQPKWTKEQAIQVGTKFLGIFTDPKDVQLGAPTAQYSHIGSVPYKTKSGEKTYLGSWYVQGQRVDSHGHPFIGDGITIAFHEGYGPTGAGINLSTPYQEEPGDPIAVEDAIAVARDLISRKRHWYSFFSKSHDDSPVQNASLQIILPSKDPNIIAGPSSDAARLAWVIKFKAPAESLFAHYFIWIDAHTGAFLGRDAI